MPGASLQGLSSGLPCGSGALVEVLSHQLKGLWEQVSKLCTIREDEQEIYRVFKDPTEPTAPALAPRTERQLQATLTGSSGWRCAQWRRLETCDFWPHNKAPSLSAVLQVLNRCSALGMGEKDDLQLGRHHRCLSLNQQRNSHWRRPVVGDGGTHLLT